MTVRTPESISAHVLALCREINPDAAPVYITITPGEGCAADDCFECVRQKVERDGGSIQFGWSIWEWPRVYVEAEHHAVYEPPTGPPWVDLTPSPERHVRRRLFLPDDRATYDFANEGVLRDNKRMALTDDPVIQEFFTAAEERVRILNSVPGVGDVIDAETEHKLSKAELGVLRLTERLGMKYTTQNAFCFYGSELKFKRCHGQSMPVAIADMAGWSRCVQNTRSSAVDRFASRVGVCLRRPAEIHILAESLARADLSPRWLH